MLFDDKTRALFKLGFECALPIKLSDKQKCTWSFLLPANALSLIDSLIIDELDKLIDFVHKTFNSHETLKCSLSKLKVEKGNLIEINLH